MDRWQYCRVCREKLSGFIFEKFGPVVHYYEADGADNRVVSEQDTVSSTVAALAQQGWEVVDWQPNSYDRKGGVAILKRRIADRRGH